MMGLMDQDEEVHPVNIGNPVENTMLELAEAVLKAVPKSTSTIKHEPLPVDDPKKRCPDISKAKRVLGWEPKIDLAAGLIETTA